MAPHREEQFLFQVVTWGRWCLGQRQQQKQTRQKTLPGTGAERSQRGYLGALSSWVHVSANEAGWPEFDGKYINCQDLRSDGHTGVKGTALQWSHSYLCHHFQKLEVNGHLPLSAPIGCRVFQGSVLSPLLFLCYINSIYYSTNLVIFLFADDTSCLA
jgi:hypothetical protein